MLREGCDNAGEVESGTESSLELIARADVCLYEAKALGRDKVVLATPQPA